jgi:outer membrane cobalamin receptor
MRPLNFLTMAGILLPLQVVAGTEPEKNTLKYLQGLSLEELMEVPIGVAAKHTSSLRETPGIVTVITADEIAKSGARDLIDVLRTVPGLDFGADVANIVGIGVRGSWAHEGGLLLLIDGIEMNERSYATNQFGQHYPLAHIQRIEIMRSAGSVIYGGMAKLGVINIITKSAEDLEGVHLAGSYGKMSKAIGHQNLSLMAGEVIDDLKVSFLATKGTGQRSDRTYTDVFGKQFDMANSNHTEPQMVNFGVQYKGLSFRMLLDKYRTDNLDDLVHISSFTTTANFKNHNYDLRYQENLNPQLKLNVNLNYSQQTPWEFLSYIPSYPYSRQSSERYLGSVNLQQQFSEYFNLIAGVEYRQEKFTNFGIDTTTHINNHNQTLFVESLYKGDWGNLTLGARYDEHSQFGSNLAPRLGFTRILGDFHIKALYSHAFRAPVGFNILLGPEIHPERTQNTEFSIGYDVNKNILLTANVFNIKSKDTIMYGVSPTATSAEENRYYNAEKSGTRGAELEARWKDTWGYVTTNYSYYRVTQDSLKDYQAFNYQTGENHDKERLAFAAHKASLNSSFNITPKLSLNPSLVWYGSRYGYNQSSDSGQLVLAKYKPTLLANLFLRQQDFLTKNLDVGIGVYNLLNKDFEFIQPYNAGHAPLPDKSREFVVNFNYKL